MADNALAKIADAAHAVETNAEELSTLLASQGAEEASKLFSQCAKAAHEVVQQVPAAPGNQPEEAQPGEPSADQQAADAAAQAPPSGGDRTPYAAGAREITKSQKRG